MSAGIPIVDFGAGSVLTEEEDINQDTLKKAGEDIIDAFRRSGFCYVKNHGIQESFLEQLRASSREFFMRPTSFKEKYRRQADNDDYIGWVGQGEEAPNPKRPGDLRECFNVLPRLSWLDWPEDVLPEFRRNCDEFFKLTVSMATRMLKAIGLALGLPDNNDLVRCHSLTGKPGSVTQIRTLYYPAVEQATGVQEGQARLGEHFVFGSLAILFQDQCGGLEVRSKKGEWIPATPIAGTAMVNIGEILQRWSADDFVATRHRMLLPEVKDSIPESQAMVLYVHPDDDSIIKCLDGSDKYPPITCGKLMSERMHSVYVESK